MELEDSPETRSSTPASKPLPACASVSKPNKIWGCSDITPVAFRDGGYIPRNKRFPELACLEDTYGFRF